MTDRSIVAKKYSFAEDYPKVALNAIKQMVKQTGEAVIDDEGIMQKGVIIRHLVLPNHVENSKKALEMLFDAFGNTVYYSIMAQYTPMPNVTFDELKRGVTEQEYDAVLDAAERLGIENGFCQELGSIGESFIPDFDV